MQEPFGNFFDKLKTFVGLQINEIKSKIYFSKACSRKEEIINNIKFQENELLVKYLGLPVSSNQIKDKDYARLYDIIQNKIDHWSSKLLSIAGGLELTHTVIIAIIMYWIQAHNIPAKALDKIVKICANFIWK